MNFEKKLQEQLFGFLEQNDEKKYLYDNRTCLALKPQILGNSNLNDLKKECNKLYMCQLEFDKVREQELFYLLDVFKKNSIKVVNFKGLTLAYDIYSDIHSRKSRDIDILVSVKDLKKILEIFDDCGYLVEKTNKKPKDMINEYLVEKKNQLSNIKHIKPVYKIINGISLHIDIHLNPNKNMEKKENVKSLFENAVKIEIKNRLLYVLEIHDRIINLSGHFKEHLDSKINKFLDRDSITQIFINFGQLHDIALLIGKYCSQINWKYLRKRSEELGQLVYVAFSLKLILSIYGEKVEGREDIEKMLGKVIVQPDNNLIGMDRVFAFLMQESIDKKFFFNVENYIIKIFEKIVGNNKKIRLNENGYSKKIKLFKNGMQTTETILVRCNNDAVELELNEELVDKIKTIRIILFKYFYHNNNVNTIRKYIYLDLKNFKANFENGNELLFSMVKKENIQIKFKWKDAFEKVIEPLFPIQICFILDGCNQDLQLSWPDIKFVSPFEFGTLIS